jgi:hypothetical protein
MIKLLERDLKIKALKALMDMILYKATKYMFDIVKY